MLIIGDVDNWWCWQLVMCCQTDYQYYNRWCDYDKQPAGTYTLGRVCWWSRLFRTLYAHIVFVKCINRAHLWNKWMIRSIFPPKIVCLLRLKHSQDSLRPDPSKLQKRWWGLTPSSFVQSHTIKYRTNAIHIESQSCYQLRILCSRIWFQSHIIHGDLVVALCDIDLDYKHVVFQQ